ncbi:hypothetical protein [uncultured Cocleimonas sp.]|uniref:hypothetical protein n=1 Tax=uncultured Cocleimonas sp. TaxID=1051587 RepID=UPI00260431A6|nr:hypothetical protein [uncultured Cocleimonas sp.]
MTDNHQAIKPVGKYSEDIDWDIIYRTFHNPKDIAERIAFELTDHQAPVIFCGFPETAAYLATASELQFVDKSAVVTQRTEERYPDIHSVTQGDISSILKDTLTRNVVISCRLSAFWQTEQDFEALANAILAHPRDQIIIDFFDREAVFEGMHIYYHAEAPDTDKNNSQEEKQQSGDWDFKQFDDSQSNNPSFQIANIDVSYFIDNNSNHKNDINFSYETRRAFFTKMAILNWCTKTFPNYETTLATGLLEGDPSFLVNLKQP